MPHKTFANSGLLAVFVSLCQPCDELSTCPGCTLPSSQLELAPAHNADKDKWLWKIDGCLLICNLLYCLYKNYIVIVNNLYLLAHCSLLPPPVDQCNNVTPLV